MPSPVDLPNPGIKPGSPACRWILYQLSYQGSPICGYVLFFSLKKKKKDWNCQGRRTIVFTREERDVVTEKVITERRFKDMRQGCMNMQEKRMPGKGRASAKTMRQECSWHDKGRPGWKVLLEQSELRWTAIDEVVQEAEDTLKESNCRVLNKKAIYKAVHRVQINQQGQALEK